MTFPGERGSSSLARVLGPLEAFLQIESPSGGSARGVVERANGFAPAVGGVVPARTNATPLGSADAL